ncbi:MAG: imidazole glycerol phosphate synthase subunit HisH [Caldilineaceae bacterium]
MITIVDYGMGNLGSIKNMFKHIGVAASITGNPDEIASADKLLLPGVGAFDSAMTRINNSGLREILDHKALVERVPVLGICLGMQLLTTSSEEGSLPGLGWIPAVTTRFPSLSGLKVPHMGWNEVTPVRDSRLIADLPPHSRFYFVHSYCVHVIEPEDSILQSTYALTFDAAIEHDNIYGAQFHPEKSHKFGMKLLSNFAGI